MGAVLGDALGMPHETLPAKHGTLQRPAFGKAYKGHPNNDLLPGQYTDDGQMILIASRILADTKAGGSFNTEAYAKELLRTYSMNKFRFPDAVLFSACKRMDTSKNLLESGVSSESAGCVSLAIPFAISYKSRREMADVLLSVCRITHTHPASFAASLGVALMLNTLLEKQDVDAAFTALNNAAKNMDADLEARLNAAYRFEESGMSLGEAAARIGTTSSVYHTIPMAAFLCRRYFMPEEILAAATMCGGNAGTIAMICGAFVGARFGIESLPGDLLRGLERGGIFDELALRLYTKTYGVEEDSKETGTEE